MSERAKLGQKILATGSIWLNGRRESFDAVHISARDRGFTLADGLFETMRVESGVVFRLDRHLDRLARGLGVLRMRAVPQIRDWVQIACREAPPGPASIRLTVTRGVGPGGIATTSDGTPTVVVALDPMPAFPSAIYERGLAAHVASGRRNPHAITAGLKTIAYTDNIVAWFEAQDASASEAIFLDTDGHCSEAIASNLFVWTGDTLLTPPLSCAVLPGVTRDAVIEIASALGMATAERAFGLDELHAARRSEERRVGKECRL